MAKGQLALPDIITPELAYVYLRDPVRFVREVIFNVNWVGLGGKYEVTPQQEQMLRSIATGKKNVSVRAGRGVGKAQPLDTVIPTPDGPRRFGDLSLGDYVFGSNGEPVRVVGIYPQGVRDIYDITFDDGSRARSCDKHTWTVKGRNERRKNLGWVNMDTDEIIKKGVKRPAGNGRFDRQFEVPTLSSSVKYNSRDIDIDPYTLGVWLGDGTRLKGSFTSYDMAIVEAVRRSYEVNHLSNNTFSVHGLMSKLRDIGIGHLYSYEKSIPDDYKYNTEEVRIEVLRGLLDTDGTVGENGTIEFGSTSKRLKDDVVEIARSLGFKVRDTLAIKKTSYRNDCGENVECRDFYRCTIATPDGIILFNLKRKQDLVRKTTEYRYYGKKFIESIEYVGREESMCIEVESCDHLYVTTDFVLTHNSSFLAWLVIWWICLHDDTQVVLTAPSLPQLRSVLWKAVGDWVKKSYVRNCFEYTQTKLYRKDNNMVWAEPRTASKIESAQGLHNDSLLIIADEASGIEDEIMETLYGSLTGPKNRMFLMFNPTRVNGFAYDTHNKNKNIWSCMRFSSEDSPIVDKDWLSSMKAKHVCGGTISDPYRVHVLGEFPTGDPESILSFEDVYASRDRVVERKGVVEIGVDLAEMGDDQTVVCPRVGNYVLTASDIGFDNHNKLCSWGNTKAPETIKKILQIVDLTREATKYTDIIKIKLDNGGLGAPIISFLEEHQTEYGIYVVRVNFNGNGGDDDRNEATRMWFHLKDVIDEIQLPYDDFLLEELVSRRWMMDDSGKRKIEQKKIFKKRFGSSPDRADAVVLAFADCDNARNVVSSLNNPYKKNVQRSDKLACFGDKYSGVFVSQTGILSVVNVSYHGGIVGAYECASGPVDDVLKTGILSDSFVMTTGNDTMFSGNLDIGMKLLMSGVAIVPPVFYNEAASVSVLDAITDQERFVVGDMCEELSKQLNTWKVEKGISTLKENNGMCYALLHILSVLAMQHPYDFTKW